MMDAQVTNPWDIGIEVTSVAVAVEDAGPGCPAAMLRFAPMTATVLVAPQTSGVVPVEVTMAAEATDACRGVSWPLEFTARAVGPDGEALTASEPTGGGVSGSGGSGPGSRDLRLVAAVASAGLLLGAALFAARRFHRRAGHHRRRGRVAVAGAGAAARPVRRFRRV
jgi:hypothetical protein